MQTSDLDPFFALVNEFESRVLAQQPVGAAHYDEAYFAEDWREERNRYDLETRRRVEGRNPLLIRDVLQPCRVLDVGCGPGFLMTLLHELGVDADGVDFSPASRSLAPPGIGERIEIGPVDDLRAADASYDVVICRAVLEHLTVLQIRRTVAEICRVSSRFAYVTTRFHPAPNSLLDLTTQFEIDPTHITLLAKDFLRCLFVLEGYRHRADLEARLDWAGKRRVLVYERAMPARGRGAEAG